MADDGPALPYEAVGKRIRSLREAKAISRKELATKLRVDVSSLAGWEHGMHLPRENVRGALARALGCDRASLFPSDGGDSAAVAAATVDTIDELPALLVDCTRKTRRLLRALRIAAPYPTAAYVQVEWRKLVDQRLLEGSLEVQRAEVFYDLKRLREVLSNILRYDGYPYYVKSFCPGPGEVLPGMGGYFFDDDEFMLGAYWSGVPPHHKRGLRMSGRPFRDFFNDFWEETWRRGTWLNMRGAHDLSAVESVALKLGLRAGQWKRFVREAERLEIGDGAPPLI